MLYTYISVFDCVQRSQQKNNAKLNICVLIIENRAQNIPVYFVEKNSNERNI